jgi:hypothetical protein
MATVDAATGAGREQRSVVIIPFGTVDKWNDPPAERQAYEERLLCSLLDLHDPNLRMIYVSSLPIGADIIDYHLSLLPSGMRRLARSRLTLVALGDDGARSLAEKLLERPHVLERIRWAIPDPRRCHLAPYNATVFERDLALALDIPMYAADPRHARLGTKSGCRELFAQAGVPNPLGEEHLTDTAGVIAAIIRLRAARPDLTHLVVVGWFGLASLRGRPRLRAER